MTKKIFHFTVILSGVDDTTENLEDQLFEAGCDDALINFRNGLVYLDFAREAKDFESPVFSSIQTIFQSKISNITLGSLPTGS